MKKLLLALLILPFSGLCLNKDSTVTHEVGLNIGPIVTGIMGSANSSQFFGVQYKRAKNNGAFRAGVYGRSDQEFNYINPVISAPLDSGLIFAQQKNSRMGIGWLKAGYERRTPMGNQLNWIYGADLMAGLSQKTDEYENILQFVDSIKFTESGRMDVYARELSRNKASTEVMRSTNLGVSVFTGFTYNFTPRFSLTGIIRADSYASFGQVVSTPALLPTSSSYHYRSYNFDMGALLGELSLFYRF